MTLDVLCVGEALWDLAAPRPFAEASALSFTPGGAAVNVALALARRGLAVGLAAVVGDDALGQALRARVAAAGVDVSGVNAALPRTGLLFTDGARFVGYRSADELPPRLPAGARARALLLTGLMPAEEHGRAFLAAARDARAGGATVLVDLNARPRVWRGRDPEPALAVLAAADVLKASTDDAAVLGLGEPDAALAALRARMPAGGVVVLTAGGKEARATGPFGEVRAAPALAHAGPALGAGDAFVAGLLAELLAAPAADPAGWARVLAAAHASAARHLAG